MQVSNPIYRPPAAPIPIWHVPVSLSLWIVSVFLLYQGAAFLRWATKNKPEAPNARAGMWLAWISTAVITIFFCFHSSTFLDPIDGLQANRDNIFSMGFIFLIGLIALPFRDPESFTETLLFSSLPIGMIAAFNFFMAFVLGRSVHSSPLARSPQWIVVVGLFNLLQIAGSIASLLAFFR